MSTPFSTGEIVAIAIGGALMILLWLFAIVSGVRFYGSKEPVGYGREQALIESKRLLRMTPRK